MIQAAQMRSAVVPPEVSAFAAKLGVRAELLAVLEMTCRVFPNTTLNVQIEDDPEIANDRHIVLVVAGVNLPVEEALEARYEWHRELFGCCPAPLVCTFRLGMELKP